jgi:hypothetical protein
MRWIIENYPVFRAALQMPLSGGARSQAASAQQLDGPQQRQNRVRNQLHQILLQIQTPAECGRNH